MEKPSFEQKLSLEQISAELNKAEEDIAKLEEFDIAKAMEENPGAFYGKTEIEISEEHDRKIEELKKRIDYLAEEKGRLLEEAK